MNPLPFFYFVLIFECQRLNLQNIYIVKLLLDLMFKRFKMQKINVISKIINEFPHLRADIGQLRSKKITELKSILQEVRGIKR